MNHPAKHPSSLTVFVYTTLTLIALVLQAFGIV